ncbi:MAG: hypothetical protein IJY62_02400 [Clostridia bacterium]|nr:hypothetical protein [Clostridia bacterium]
MNFEYHESIVSQVNAVKPRSYYIPFADKNFTFNKSDSPFVDMLKTWRFAHFPSLPENAETIPLYKEEEVPFCWQMRGYDKHRYLNVVYPIPVRPPFIDFENACGIYETDYNVEEKSGRYYINFEGVDSCIYLFVNGVFVGYSTVSHCTAEFDITDYLTKNNKIRAVVFKWSSATYLEDQDKLRMSGIFRDAYILRRPEGHLRDYKITTKVTDDGGMVAFNADSPCEIELYYKDELIGTASGESATFAVKNAKLWTSETPELYTLVIFANGEYIREYVGIRQVETDGTVFKINGKPVKFKGVNRHSMTADKGYTEGIEDLEKDLKLFKKYNINAVRTSHYPPHPLLPVLCDIYGIYLMVEADMEMHGLTQHEGGYGYEGTRLIAEDPAWADVFVHRAERMYARDKNRSSVVVWSLGNEAGWGENFIAMAKYLKSVDNRPIHYEAIVYQDPEGWFNTPWLDFSSKMYPSVPVMQADLEKGMQKPYVLCEYTHAMGNSCGDVKNYWELIYAREELCGAFVWEWCDHTVRDGEKLLYGGDFGEAEGEHTDGNFCVDGLVNTDRTPHSSLKEVAEVYAPACVVTEEGAYIVRNRRDFLSLDDLSCTCKIEVNGVAVKSFSVDVTGIPARGEKKIFVNTDEYSGYVTVNFFFEKDGEYVSSCQTVVKEALPLREKKGTIALKKENGCVLVKGESYEATVDQKGRLASYQVDGKELIEKPVELNVYRARTDNDVRATWLKGVYGFTTAKFFCRSIELAENKVIANGVLVTAGRSPLATVCVTYAFFGNGIGVSLTADVREWVPELPRIGFEFKLDGSLKNVEYFGRGTVEAYEDRKLAAPVGLYKQTVGEMYVHYTKPQENGAHVDSRRVCLCSGEHTVEVQSAKNFSFSVAPFAVKAYKKHDYEMVDTGDVWLYVDYRNCGVGSAACGPELDVKYRIIERKIEFSFDLFAK